MATSDGFHPDFPDVDATPQAGASRQGRRTRFRHRTDGGAAALRRHQRKIGRRREGLDGRDVHPSPIRRRQSSPRATPRPRSTSEVATRSSCFTTARREVRVKTQPGDYIFVPPFVPHREEEPVPTTPAEVVIARTSARGDRGEPARSCIRCEPHCSRRRSRSDCRRYRGNSVRSSHPKLPVLGTGPATISTPHSTRSARTDRGLRG